MNTIDDNQDVCRVCTPLRGSEHESTSHYETNTSLRCHECHHWYNRCQQFYLKSFEMSLRRIGRSDPHWLPVQVRAVSHKDSWSLPRDNVAVVAVDGRLSRPPIALSNRWSIIWFIVSPKTKSLTIELILIKMVVKWKDWPKSICLTSTRE